MERDEIQRRGISGTVIRSMRNQLEMREFTTPQFVEYLSGFGISVGVILLCLQRAEEIQCAAGEMRVDQNVLKQDDQTTTSERRDEPRKSCRRHECVVIRRLNRKAKRSHVLQGAPKQSIEFLIAGLNFYDRLQPFRQSLGMWRLFAAISAMARRSQTRGAVF